MCFWENLVIPSHPTTPLQGEQRGSRDSNWAQLQPRSFVGTMHISFYQLPDLCGNAPQNLHPGFSSMLLCCLVLSFLSKFFQAKYHVARCLATHAKKHHCLQLACCMGGEKEELLSLVLLKSQLISESSQVLHVSQVAISGLTKYRLSTLFPKVLQELFFLAEISYAPK